MYSLFLLILYKEEFPPIIKPKAFGISIPLKTENACFGTRKCSGFKIFLKLLVNGLPNNFSSSKKGSIPL